MSWNSRAFDFMFHTWLKLIVTPEMWFFILNSNLFLHYNGSQALETLSIVWENKPLPAVTEGFKYTNNPAENIQKSWSLFKFKENLMKEIREDLNKWRDIPWSWLGWLNIIKTSVLPNLTYKFNAIPISLILKFIWIGRRSRIACTIWKEDKDEDWHYLTYYKVNSNQVVGIGKRIYK